MTLNFSLVHFKWIDLDNHLSCREDRFFLADIIYMFSTVWMKEFWKGFYFILMINWEQRLGFYFISHISFKNTSSTGTVEFRQFLWRLLEFLKHKRTGIGGKVKDRRP